MHRFNRKPTAPKVLKRIRERHAKTRAFQRYGVELTKNDFHQIVRLIQTKKGISLGRISHTRSTWIVFFNGREFVVGYHRPSKSIITLLPHEKGGLV